MKSEYLMGFVVVGTVAFLVLAVWLPVILTGRRIQRKRVDTMLAESNERARVLYLLNKVTKK